jgi:type I restriction enzyme, S subunit
MSEQELELPKGWVETILGDIITSAKGKKPKTLGKKTSKNKFPYINIKAFEKKIFDEYTDGESCPICTENDLLMVWDGSRSGLVGSGVSGVIGSTLVKLDCNGNVTKFLWYFLQSKYQALNTKQRGSGTPHVNPDILWNFKFLLPPLNEQKRIVSKIEELFSKIDSIKQSLLQIKLQLRIYDYSFQDKIFKEIKWKHESKKLIDICTKITDGTHNSPENKPQGDIPYITAKNIRPRKLDLSNLTYISKKDHDGIYSRCNPVKGDVLYTKDGVNLGFAVVNELDFEFSLLSSVALLKPNFEIINNSYLMTFLNSPSCFNFVTKKSIGSAITRIILRQIKEILIPLPPLEEQEQIVSQIEQGFSLIENTQNIVNSTLQALQTMKMSVLKQAFEGKLVPQDPNDEPAQILLEKIKATKDAQPTKKRRTKNVK